MKYTKIYVQNKLVKSDDYQTIISVDGSEWWKSTSFRWKLPPSEYATRRLHKVEVNSTGQCTFKNIEFISQCVSLPSNSLAK